MDGTGGSSIGQPHQGLNCRSSGLNVHFVHRSGVYQPKLWDNSVSQDATTYSLFRAKTGAHRPGYVYATDPQLSEHQWCRSGSKSLEMRRMDSHTWE
jgi:hypothetical protein